jgi:hypothetical protein
VRVDDDPLRVAELGSDDVRRLPSDADQLAGWLLEPEDPAEVSAYFESQRR